MADSFKIIWGTRDVDQAELIYNASTQTDYSLHHGSRFTAEMPDVLNHLPDFDEAQPVRGTNRDRTVTLIYDGHGSDVDDLLNNQAALKRAVDGADSQALRYWTDKDVPRVVLRVKLEGATNYTDIPIKYGVVNDGAALYGGAARSNDKALGTIVQLRVSPYGEGAEFTLSNVIGSSPHMIEDSDGDGLPDGWTETQSLLKQINTTSFLTGNQSFQFAYGAAGGEGIYTSLGAATATTISLYVWCRVGGADEADIVLYDQTATTTRATKTLDSTDSNSVSDLTAVGANGSTWYRVVIENQSITNGNTHRLYIYGKNASDTVYVDCAYAEYGIASCPAGFSSASTLRCINDPETGANEDRISYIDLSLLPGDAPPLIKTQIARQSGTISGYYFIGSRVSDGNQRAADYTYYVASPDLTAAGIFGSPTVDGAVAAGDRWGNTYISMTADGDGSDICTVSYSTSDLEEFFNADRRIMVIAQTDDLQNNLKLTDTDGENITFTAINTWELLDLGLIYKADRPFDLYSGSQNAFVINVNLTNANKKVYVDAVLCFPTNGEFFIGEGSIGASQNAYILPVDRQYYADSTPALDTSRGSLWYAKPGYINNRYFFTLAASDKEHELDYQYKVTFTVTPRTRHLLGTT